MIHFPCHLRGYTVLFCACHKASEDPHVLQSPAISDFQLESHSHDGFLYELITNIHLKKYGRKNA